MEFHDLFYQTQGQKFPMKNIGVFLGANYGKNDLYKKQAVSLAHEMGKRKLNVVYGGSSSSLMGDFADAAVQSGCDVFGVITKEILKAENPHKNIKELLITNTMQERKSTMFDISDAFLVLPGGLGTLEEIFEIWNAAKIGLHKKPIGVLNIGGYFDKLFDFLFHCCDEGFVNKEKINFVKIADSPALLLNEILF